MEGIERVKINYSNKSISCKGCFLWPHEVVFKIIGSYEFWAQLHDQFLKDSSKITFGTIEAHLSRANKIDIGELKMHSDDDQDSFAWYLYIEFIDQVNFSNPLNQIKKRQTTPHGMDKFDYRLLVLEARWLYVLFQYWKGKPISKMPTALIDFCKRHGVVIGRNKAFAAGVLAANVVEAMCSIYGEKTICDYSYFYRNYLLKDLPLLQKMIRGVQGIPSREPLKSLLQKKPKFHS